MVLDNKTIALGGVAVAGVLFGLFGIVYALDGPKPAATSSTAAITTSESVDAAPSSTTTDSSPTTTTTVTPLTTTAGRVVTLGHPCGHMNATAVTVSGAMAYCEQLDRTDALEWAAQPELIPNPLVNAQVNAATQSAAPMPGQDYQVKIDWGSAVYGTNSCIKLTLSLKPSDGPQTQTACGGRFVERFTGVRPGARIGFTVIGYSSNVGDAVCGVEDATGQRVLASNEGTAAMRDLPTDCVFTIE